MLTKESAAAQCAAMSDTQIEQLSFQVTGRHDDQDTLAVAAVLERGRRAEKASQAARLAAPAIAAKQSARAAYDAAGLDPAKFDAWYQERLAKETGETLDQQRAAAAYLYSKSF